MSLLNGEDPPRHINVICQGLRPSYRSVKKHCGDMENIFGLKAGRKCSRTQTSFPSAESLDAGFIRVDDARRQYLSPQDQQDLERSCLGLAADIPVSCLSYPCYADVVNRSSWMTKGWIKTERGLAINIGCGQGMRNEVSREGTGGELSLSICDRDFQAHGSDTTIS